MKDEIQQYIDNNIVENPNINLSKLSVLTQPDELHYLASVVNWDIHIPILEWIVKQAICSEATALMIFWQAQPQDFTVYRWNETQIKENITVFHLIKIIIINYTNGFYLKTDIHYNPANDKKDIFVIPNFMYKDVKGEEPYSIYDEQDVKSWFGEYLNKQINSCSSTMDLYGIACNLPILGNIDTVFHILRHPLCDKGIAFMLFWRFEPIVSEDILKRFISEICQKNYSEIIEYKHDWNNSKAMWNIPEIMMKPV